ncbi:MAG: hypothetical protein QM811_27525 [Pirellulales bacterium]
MRQARIGTVDRQRGGLRGCGGLRSCRRRRSGLRFQGGDQFGVDRELQRHGAAQHDGGDFFQVFAEVVAQPVLIEPPRRLDQQAGRA